MVIFLSLRVKKSFPKFVIEIVFKEKKTVVMKLYLGLSKTTIDMIEPTRPVVEMTVRRTPSTQNAKGETSDITIDFYKFSSIWKLKMNEITNIFKVTAKISTRSIQIKRNLFFVTWKILWQLQERLFWLWNEGNLIIWENPLEELFFCGQEEASLRNLKNQIIFPYGMLKLGRKKLKILELL